MLNSLCDLHLLKRIEISQLDVVFEFFHRAAGSFIYDLMLSDQRTRFHMQVLCSCFCSDLSGPLSSWIVLCSSLLHAADYLNNLEDYARCCSLRNGSGDGCFYGLMRTTHNQKISFSSLILSLNKFGVLARHWCAT